VYEPVEGLNQEGLTASVEDERQASMVSNKMGVSKSDVPAPLE
jgi:hypothetical protein